MIELRSRNDIPLLFPKNSVGIELGVWHGEFAITLFHICKPSKLYLVDLWEPNHQQLGCFRWGNFLDEVSRKFTEEILQDKVEIHKRGSIDFLYGLEDNSLDWAYLDTCHEYEHTRQELDALILKVKPGGFICGHDFVVEQNVWDTGVVRAVIERIQAGKLYMTHITNERFPSFVCRNQKA